MKLLLQPLPIRIFHWIMFACVMVLLFTGLYLSSPFETLVLPLRAVRALHLIFGLILIANLSGQIYYYVYTTKWTELIFLPRDLVNLRSFFRYVFFITDGHPNYGRYNPGQKLLFSLWFLTVVIAAITGIILMLPNHTSAFQRLLGGLSGIRLVHFMGAIFFAMSIPLHFYLVFTEDLAKLQAMFTGYVNVEPSPRYAKTKPADLPGHPEGERHK